MEDFNQHVLPLTQEFNAPSPKVKESPPPSPPMSPLVLERSESIPPSSVVSAGLCKLEEQNGVLYRNGVKVETLDPASDLEYLPLAPGVEQAIRNSESKMMAYTQEEVRRIRQDLPTILDYLRPRRRRPVKRPLSPSAESPAQSSRPSEEAHVHDLRRCPSVQVCAKFKYLFCCLERSGTSFRTATNFVFLDSVSRRSSGRLEHGSSSSSSAVSVHSSEAVSAELGLSPSPEEVEAALRSSGVVCYYIFQLEKAPSTGQLHYQGYLRMSSPKAMARVKALFAPWQPHLEKCNGAEEKNIAYCSKEESRVAGPWTSGEVADAGTSGVLKEAVQLMLDKGLFPAVQEYPQVFAKHHSGLQFILAKHEEQKRPSDAGFAPYPWQADLMAMLQGVPNDREILWVVDPAGHAGKSRLCTHLILEHGAILLEGSIQNMAYLYNKERIVLFDVSRSAVEVTSHLYGFAEKLKNGWVTSTKYQPVNKCFAAPHVVFFSNAFPDKSKWTKDRYKVYGLQPVAAGCVQLLEAVAYDDIPDNVVVDVEERRVSVRHFRSGQ